MQKDGFRFGGTRLLGKIRRQVKGGVHGRKGGKESVEREKGELTRCELGAGK